MSNAKDLRSFIALLEEEYPQHIIHIKKEVSPDFEASAIMAKLDESGLFPAVVFENISGAKHIAVDNMHADIRRYALAMGLPENAGIKEMVDLYCHAQENPVEPVMVPEGPVQEIIQTGDDVDLSELPVLKYHEKDAGRYITLANCVLKDPDSGIRNIGVYRLMMQGKNQVGMYIGSTSQGNYIMQKYRRMNKPMEMAVVLGHHPIFHIGCQSAMPLGVDEYTIVGGLMGEPLPLVKCKTIDMEVPAYAEIVLECVIYPDEFALEAPFGEAPGTYGKQRNSPVVHVKAITKRHDALYQGCFVGHRDNLLLQCISRSAALLKVVQIACPTVVAVNKPLAGRCRYIAYIAMDKMLEGDPKNAACAAFAADPILKYAIVVDKDVNINRDDDVLHAIATRVRADRDTFMVTYARGSQLDPTNYEGNLVTKVGIDATRAKGYPEEIRVPGMRDVDLENLLRGWKNTND